MMMCAGAPDNVQGRFDSADIIMVLVAAAVVVSICSIWSTSS